MVTGLDDIKAVEDLLRGSGVTITPVEPTKESETDLQTVDGRFTIAPARNIDRQENSVTLYRTDTAEPIPTDLNEVVKRLRKRFPTTGDFALTYPQLMGRNAFTIGVKNSEGVLGPPAPILNIDVSGELCWLNPKSEKFGYTRSLGIRSVCRSIGLWSPLRLEQHIRSKHEGVWPQHEQAEARNRRDEDKDARAVSDERIAQLIEIALGQRDQKPAFTESCPKCEREFTKETEAGVKAAVRTHLRNCK